MKRVTEIYVFVADNFGPAGSDLPDEEGVIAEMLELPSGLAVFSPFFTTKPENVHHFMRHAQRVANVSHKQVRVLRIHGSVEVIEALEPIRPATINPAPKGVQ